MGGWIRHSARRNVVVTSGEQHEDKSRKQNAGPAGSNKNEQTKTKTKEKAEKIRFMRRMYLYLLIFNDTDVPVNESTDIILFTGFTDIYRYYFVLILYNIIYD